MLPPPEGQPYSIPPPKGTDHKKRLLVLALFLYLIIVPILSFFFLTPSSTRAPVITPAPSPSIRYVTVPPSPSIRYVTVPPPRHYDPEAELKCLEVESRKAFLKANHPELGLEPNFAKCDTINAP